MNLSKEEIENEENYLDETESVIDKELSSLSEDLLANADKIEDFKRYLWDNKSGMDKEEIKSIMTDSDLEVFMYESKGNYLTKLYKVRNSPYFASIIFKDENEDEENIYIGITHLKTKEKYYIHDWRAPICSLFYDFEVGKATYISPLGPISGNLKRKRQYKIESRKLVHVFDNAINIDDDILQEVLATQSNDKMKNIVNTIQQEQNEIIRNTEDKNLVVQGIAGSGKTSVALHRIAFLLYRIKNLKSNNVLIFSPNNIFAEYISDVLPELGEDNTKETTYYDYLSSVITEYKYVESFISFVERYYKYQDTNEKLTIYKQSNIIIEDLINYINDLTNNAVFKTNITDNLLYNYTKNSLNNLFHERYSKFKFFERIDAMATKLSEINYNGKKNHVASIRKKLYESMGIEKDYKKIFFNFFKSKYCRIALSDTEIKSFVNKSSIKYEDASIFVFIKGLMEGFPYNNTIKQIVIDEAQDYTVLQFIILKEIFKNASFTILGDCNQTINPYYKYESLEKVTELFKNSVRYLELNKTYRSTKEIIEYTNKILGLNHVSAIRKENTKPVLTIKFSDLRQELITTVDKLSKIYKSIAIITKDDEEAEKIYKLIKDDCNIALLSKETTNFIKDLIVLPAYIAKGLEFDCVIIYNDKNNKFKATEKNLYYVAATRAQQQLIIFE